MRAIASGSEMGLTEPARRRRRGGGSDGLDYMDGNWKLDLGGGMGLQSYCNAL